MSELLNTIPTIGRLGGVSEQETEISKKAISALKKIGSESRINKLRVKKLGIHVD